MLDKLLRLSVGWLSSIVFIYGIIQKYILFPIYLSNLSSGENFYAKALYIRLKGGRIFSIFALPTLYSFICTVLILFIFHYFVTSLKDSRKPAIIKIFWAVLMVMGTFNLLLTQSFGGIVYLGAGGLIYLLGSGILKSRYLIPALSVLALILFITTALRFKEVKKLEPVKLRFSNWVQASRIIADYPFWGVGLGNYESTISAYTLSHEAKSIYSHNFFLQFTAESGIVVPVVLLLFLFLYRKKLNPGNPDDKTLYLAVLAALFFYNLIDIGLYFFSAGIIAVVVLSQLYPSKQPLLKFNGQKIATLSVFLILSTFLVVEAISDSSRKEGDFLNSQKEYDSATVFYKRSLKVNPFNYKAMVGLANIMFSGPDSNEAQHYLQQALALNPDYPYANFLQSRVLYKQKRYLKSFYYAQTAHQKNKLNPVYKKWADALHKNLAEALKQQKAPQESL